MFTLKDRPLSAKIGRRFFVWLAHIFNFVYYKYIHIYEYLYREYIKL